MYNYINRHILKFHIKRREDSWGLRTLFKEQYNRIWAFKENHFEYKRSNLKETRKNEGTVFLLSEALRAETISPAHLTTCSFTQLELSLVAHSILMCGGWPLTWPEFLLSHNKVTRSQQWGKRHCKPDGNGITFYALVPQLHKYWYPFHCIICVQVAPNPSSIFKKEAIV